MKISGIYLLLAFSLTALATSCQTKTKVDNLTAEEFHQKMMDVKSKTILDVRTADEYKSGHISDAINLDIDSAGFTAGLKMMDKSEPVFVYCLSGARSDKAVEEMKKLGFREVFTLKGGILAWQNAGLPMDKWPSKNNPHDVVLSLSDFQNSINQNKTVMVDFNATWCQPCKMQAPILEQIAREKGDSLLFLSIDVDKNLDLAKSEMIQALPTLIIYKGGKQTWKNIGLTNKAIIEQALNKQ